MRVLWERGYEGANLAELPERRAGAQRPSRPRRTSGPSSTGALELGRPLTSSGEQDTHRASRRGLGPAARRASSPPHARFAAT